MLKRPTAEQRRMLGTFLATKRGRLQPSDLGLPSGPRRTPGLRREEVAVLAGVSISWYTWLEQGRDIQASGDTLRRVSDVLHLDQVEAAYLCALSSRELPTFRANEHPTDAVVALVRAMDPIPSYVRNSRLDILVWNDAITNLFVDYAKIPPHERNTLRLLFLHQPYRSLILDWEQMARGMVSTLRAARAKAVDKAPFDELVESLSSVSPEFREWWPDVDVRGFHEGCKRLRHPTLGRLDLTYICLAPEGQPDLTVTAYMPRPVSLDLER